MFHVKHVIGADFETYYDSDYSLKKMPTHQYVRDERFKCLGCGFEFPGEAPFYARDHAETEAVFRRIDGLGWENVALVCHNAGFDGTVLWERFGKRKPGLWLDTQLMARYLIAQGKLPPTQKVSLAALAPLVGMAKGDTWAAVHGSGKELADYGLEDVRIMMALLRLWFQKSILPAEIEYMDMKIRSMTEPALDCDEPLLIQAATITEEDKALHKLLRKDANMVALLEQCGIEVEYKTTPKGKRKPALAKTDAFMQELVAGDHGLATELASRRLEANSSITHTRAARFLAVGTPLPMPYLYYAAHTGRDGGYDDLNMQNLPKKGPLRRALKAPPGWKFAVGDSGQIEARGVGWLAGDPRLLEIFREADAHGDPLRDAYRLFGGRYMLRKEPEELAEEERDISKAGLLGLGFGQGWRGLQAGSRRRGLIIPDDISQLAQRAYRGGFDRVPKWWKRLMQQVIEQGYIELHDGRRMIYPDVGEEVINEETGEESIVFYRPTIFSKNVPRGQRQRVKLWHGLVAENVTQAEMRSAVFWQAARMREDGIRVLGMSHDEVIALAPESEAQEVAAHMKRWLHTTPPWLEGLPLVGKVKIGDNYQECK